MIKIISGKKYDTSTAKPVGQWENDNLPGCIDYVEEQLFRKRTGEFFLYGYGGPNTKYGNAIPDNGRISGSEIIPLTYQAAQKWAEEHLTTDEYEAIFGEIEEDDTKTQLSVSITTAAAEKVKRDAARAGVSVSAYVDQIILSK
jgi:hypothetical protein